MVKRGALEERFDPDMNLYVRKILTFKYPVGHLKQFLKVKPQYGSNQSGIERTSKEEARYVRITDIDEYGNLKDNLGATAEVIENKYVLNDNNILFARSGATVGKSYLHQVKNVDYTCFFAGYMIRFIVDEKRLLPAFLFSYTQLNVYKEWTKAIQRAAGQPNINSEEYKELFIPIPPIEIQAQIVQKFNQAYELKRQKEAEAKALLESIDGYLLKKLGIELPTANEPKKFFYTRFKDVQGKRFDPSFHQIEFQDLINAIKKHNYSAIKNIVSFSNESWNQKDFFENTFPYIEISEIDTLTGEIKNVNQIAINDAPSRAKMIVRENDIIVSTTRPNRGAIAKISENQDFSIASTGFAVIRYLKVKELLKEYLHIILRHRICLNQMSQRSSGGNYPAITQEELGNIIIPLPTLSIQNEIVAHITDLRQRAKTLEAEAKEAIETAKAEVERMILGES